MQREGLPLHETPQKNFDRFLPREIVIEMDKDAAIVDLGCGRAYALSFLHALGFSNFRGIDLALDRWARARQALVMLCERTLRPLYRLTRGDLTRTSLPSASQDVALSISTIEHGVNVQRFLAEAVRLLRSGGLLFVTTDHWENKIDTDGAQAFGLPWQIFSREQIIAPLNIARRFGLLPAESSEIPACEDKPVFWQGRRYTFVAMLFKKCESQQ
jgi:SAM-dependent methyltransferase